MSEKETFRFEENEELRLWLGVMERGSIGLDEGSRARGLRIGILDSIFGDVIALEPGVCEAERLDLMLGGPFRVVGEEKARED